MRAALIIGAIGACAVFPPLVFIGVFVAIAVGADRWMNPPEAPTTTEKN